MTALVTPDAVEAAAKAMHETHNGPRAVSWDKAGHHVRQAYLNNARAALAAAAPLIAQQAIEDAADEWGAVAWEDAYVAHPVVDDVSSVQAAVIWLTTRATTLTPKDTP